MITAFPDAIEIDGQMYDTPLEDDLYINEGNLSGEFVRHAQRFAFYATAFELSLRKEKELDFELDRMYAKIDYNVRMEARNASVKITEKMVENSVITKEEYGEVFDELQQAKKNTGLLKQARDAMIHRRDMLIQLGATQRAERASDISLKTDVYKSRFETT